MCLNKIDPKIRVRNTFGWQVFRVSEGRLYPLYHGTESQEEEKLQISNQRTIKTISSDVPLKKLKNIFGGDSLDLEDSEVSYMSGYHIFLRKSDADLYAYGFRDAVVRKVYFYIVETKGYQNFSRKIDEKIIYAHAPCVVAKTRNICYGRI
jgi:hypothetical protein